MSDFAILIVGLCVTVAVGGALMVLIWACIQDGHTQRAWEAQGRVHGTASRTGDSIREPSEARAPGLV